MVSLCGGAVTAVLTLRAAHATQWTGACHAAVVVVVAAAATEQTRAYHAENRELLAAVEKTTPTLCGVFFGAVT